MWFSRICFSGILFGRRLKINKSWNVNSTRVIRYFLVVLPMVVVVSTVIRVNPAFSRVRFIGRFSYRLVVVIKRVRITRIRVDLSRAMVSERFHVFKRSREVTRGRNTTMVENDIHRIATVRTNIDRVSAGIKGGIRTLSFRAVYVHLLVVGCNEVKAIRLRPGISFGVVGVNRSVIPTEALKGVTKRLLGLSVMVGCKIGVEEGGRNFAVGNRRAVVRL